MKVKLIASDLDGTLLLDNKKLSNTTKEMLKSIIDKGIYFVPATGRAFGTIPEEIRTMEGIMYAIASNGAAIYDVKTGERLYQCLLSPESVEKILTYKQPVCAVIEAFVNGKAYSEKRYIENPKAFGATDFGEKYVKETRKPVEDIKEFINIHKNELESISFVCEEKEVLLKIKEELMEQISDITTTSSVPHMLEVGSKNAGKGGTLKYLMQKLNVKQEEAMAFGDADNDIEMLQAVKYGIAMENAKEECKRIAYDVTASNEKDGVAIMMQKVLSGKI